MLDFAEEGKSENPEKNPRSKARTNKKLNTHMAPDGNRTRATFGGRRALSPLRHSSFFGTSFLFFILPFYLRGKIKLGEILQVESNYVHSA